MKDILSKNLYYYSIILRFLKNIYFLTFCRNITPVGPNKNLENKLLHLLLDV